MGGSTWKDILKHIKGEKLSDRNKHLGNQWKDFLSSKHNTRFIVIALGSNEIDSFHRLTARNPGVKTTQHMKRIKRDVNAEFDRIKKDIRKVLYFLSRHCPEAQLCYIKVTPRHSWELPARLLAKWIDYHVTVRIRKTYKIQEIWNRAIFQQLGKKSESPMYGMLRTDLVHLNQHGNTALSQSTMKSLLNKWKGKLGLFGKK